jgi:flagellar hook-basal body complex protein FliE
MVPQIQSSLALENLSGKGIDTSVSERSVLREMEAQGIQSEPGGASGEAGFSETLGKMLQNVNRDQLDADAAVKNLISGRTKNIHETMLAVEKADLSLKMMMQVRNKVLEAYREVMKMQV